MKFGRVSNPPEKLSAGKRKVGVVRVAYYQKLQKLPLFNFATSSQHTQNITTHPVCSQHTVQPLSTLSKTHNTLPKTHTVSRAHQVPTITTTHPLSTACTPRGFVQHAGQQSTLSQSARLPPPPAAPHSTEKGRKRNHIKLGQRPKSPNSTGATTSPGAPRPCGASARPRGAHAAPMRACAAPKRCPRAPRACAHPRSSAKKKEKK